MSASCILWSYFNDWLNACILQDELVLVPASHLHAPVDIQRIRLASEPPSP
jgi:hypothetical protein